MTLSDLYGHSPTAGLIECEFFHTVVQQLTICQLTQCVARSPGLR